MKGVPPAKPSEPVSYPDPPEHEDSRSSPSDAGTGSQQAGQSPGLLWLVVLLAVSSVAAGLFVFWFGGQIEAQV
jgi:uncharacterized protein HemX